MDLIVERWYSWVEDQVVGTDGASGNRRKTAVGALVRNPFAGRYVEDLSKMVKASVTLGGQLADRLKQAHGAHAVESYGKAGMVGVNGEQEHANALLTTAAATPLREAIGGGKAWISSVTKVGAVGTLLDVPLACKDALYVRSHYDAMTVFAAEAPRPNQILIVFAVASGARLNARVGGLAFADMKGQDGLN